MRAEVFSKFGGKCAYCGCELQKKWHMDHLIPVIRINVLNRDVTAYKFAKRYGLVQGTGKPVIFHFEKEKKK